MSKEYPSYNVYKGLQKPLIFKGFKGKFIYIGGACIISALLLCAIVSTLASFMWGGITLYNKPEELFGVVNGAIHKPVAE